MRRREVPANPLLDQVTRRRQNAVSTCRSLPGGRYVKRRILRTRGEPSALLRHVTLDVGEEANRGRAARRMRGSTGRESGNLKPVRRSPTGSQDFRFPSSRRGPAIPAGRPGAGITAAWSPPARPPRREGREISNARRSTAIYPFATNEEIRYHCLRQGRSDEVRTMSRVTLIEWRKYRVHSCQAENSRRIRRCRADFCSTASSSVGDESHYRRATERKAAEVEIGGGSSRR